MPLGKRELQGFLNYMKSYEEEGSDSIEHHHPRMHLKCSHSCYSIFSKNCTWLWEGTETQYRPVLALLFQPYRQSLYRHWFFSLWVASIHGAGRKCIGFGRPELLVWYLVSEHTVQDDDQNGQANYITFYSAWDNQLFVLCPVFNKMFVVLGHLHLCIL